METREKLEQRITNEYTDYKKWDAKVKRSDGVDGEAIRQRKQYEDYMNRALERYLVIDLSSIPVAEKEPPVKEALAPQSGVAYNQD